jgi:hypothetical protein
MPALNRNNPSPSTPRTPPTHEHLRGHASPRPQPQPSHPSGGSSCPPRDHPRARIRRVVIGPSPTGIPPAPGRGIPVPKFIPRRPQTSEGAKKRRRPRECLAPTVPPHSFIRVPFGVGPPPPHPAQRHIHRHDSFLSPFVVGLRRASTGCPPLGKGDTPFPNPSPQKRSNQHSAIRTQQSELKNAPGRRPPGSRS